MISITSTRAKELVMKSGYKKIYTEEIKTNGGNSGKICCKKEYIGDEVVVFILKKRGEKR